LAAFLQTNLTRAFVQWFTPDKGALSRQKMLRA
jgi:hypothetical protein